MQLAIASDEISFDFAEAVALGMSWGVERFELKRCGEVRIPDVPEHDIALVERVLDDTGASLTSLAPGLFKGPLTDAHVRDELARLDRALDLAERFSIDRVVVFGFALDERSASAVQTALVDALSAAAQLAAARGAVLVLENEPAFYVDCPDRAREIMEAVDSDALRINWDPCNSLGCACGEPFPVGYELVRPFVGHVHVKDARRHPDGRIEYVVLGQGDVDWPGQFRALAADGYDGACVLEPHFGDRVESSRAAVAAARAMLAGVEVSA